MSDILVNTNPHAQIIGVPELRARERDVITHFFPHNSEGIRFLTTAVSYSTVYCQHDLNITTAF